MPTVTVRPAVEADADLLLSFVKELAAFEREPDAVKATAEDLRRDGFGPAAVWKALIAEQTGEPAGFALYFPTYSTWEGRPGLFVEDLYVRPQARRLGVGRALLAAVAAEAQARGCARVDLNVLDWNPARDFYAAIGFRQLSVWLPYRLDGVALAALAAGSDPAG